MQKRYVIRGESMWPFLRNGSIVSPIEAEELEIGDIVVFTTGDSMKVFHRVVEIGNGETRCKGDNCLHFDSGVSNCGGRYQVVRHRFKESAARVSRFWGEHYSRSHTHNPHTGQRGRTYARALTVLQRISMLSIYSAYRFCCRPCTDG